MLSFQRSWSPLRASSPRRCIVVFLGLSLLCFQLLVREGNALVVDADSAGWVTTSNRFTKSRRRQRRQRQPPPPRHSHAVSTTCTATLFSQLYSTRHPSREDGPEQNAAESGKCDDDQMHSTANRMGRRGFGRRLLAASTATTTLTSLGIQLADSPLRANAASAFGAASGGVGAVPSTNDPAVTPGLDATQLLQRFEQDGLVQPPSFQSNTGIDNTVFPAWLEGTWEVQQTLTGIRTPLGLKYIGGPNGQEDIAQKSLTESQSKINQPVSLQLRYVSASSLLGGGGGTYEDRLFNSKQRINSFASKNVVASCDYADVRASNRAAVLQRGGSDTTPLQTVFVRFKGPAAQKTFITSHGGTYCSSTSSSNNKDESDKDCWVGYETQRSIFALTNESTAPPIFTDSELIWQFRLVDANRIQGKLRIIGYLNAQSDKLYFDARNRAVSIQDYTLDMKKVQD